MKLNYEWAIATNTRLMGVVNICFLWNEDNRINAEIFNLDFEGDGIDNHELLENVSMKKLKYKLASTASKLGAVYVDISINMGIRLIQEAYNYSLSKNYKIDEYKHILEWDKHESDTQSIEKIMTPIRSHDELINYYLMRNIGYDQSFDISALSSIDEQLLVSKPMTLLKNKNEKVGDHNYESTALIFDNTTYYQLVSDIIIKDDKIDSFDIINRMEISDTEASFQLMRREYVLVYEVLDNKIYEIFTTYLLGLLNQRHKNGNLFMHFNWNNDHVNNQNYYLNNDLFAVYFLSDNNELIVSSYFKNHLSRIKKFFKENGIDDLLKFKLEIVAQQYPSIIYQFIESHYESFIEFYTTLEG